MRMHLLPAVAAFLGVGGTQYRMALQQALEGRAHSVDVQLAVELQGARNVVHRAMRLQLPEEPQALLGERQRLALRGVERLQLRHRQHGRGRHAGIDRGGERLQVTGFEQAAQGQLDAPGMAHPADHLGGQQRMAAEVEEVVAQAYPLDAQQFAPQRRELALQGAARRFEGLCQQAGVRRRQGLAVELAVGGQWQCAMTCQWAGCM
jgi:hypothetical protein